jgi:putative FmdB family regulatory protein
MPIYAYRCTSCGHAKDVLQKVSDPVLTTCPACGAESFAKQVTAAGFQLKGSGWYATDFRGNGGAEKKPASDAVEAKPSGEAAASKPSEGGSAAAAGSTADKPASAPAPAPTPAAGR